MSLQETSSLKRTASLFQALVSFIFLHIKLRTVMASCQVSPPEARPTVFLTLVSEAGHLQLNNLLILQ